MQSRRHLGVSRVMGVVAIVVLAKTVQISAIASGTQAQQPNAGCCAVLELRQYTLKPGQRDVLIDLFDRHFIESQEALGMTIVGQFRDRRRPDRFVWIRGFADMQTRHAALERFYTGPVWARHSAAANATMIDVNDVRLLKPAQAETTFRLDTNRRPAIDEKREATPIVVGIHPLRLPADADLVSRFRRDAIPAIQRDHLTVESVFITEPAENTFTRLPVRAGNVLVWFGTLATGATPPPVTRLQETTAVLTADGGGPAEFLELEPTTRSAFGHHVSPR
jgi:hypothetical protein